MEYDLKNKMFLPVTFIKLDSFHSSVTHTYIFQLSGSLDWVNHSVSAMMLSCENQVLRNLSLWKTNSFTGKREPPPEFMRVCK